MSSMTADPKPLGERVAYLEGRVDEQSRTIADLTRRLASHFDRLEGKLDEHLREHHRP